MRAHRACALLSCLAAWSALATPSGHKWFLLPQSYRVFAHSSINGVSSFSTNVLPKVQNAFLNWTRTKVACTKWDNQYSGPFTSPSGTAAVNPNDRENSVIWLGGSSWRYGTSTLGLTTTSYYPGTGEILDADMELNNNIQWSYTGSFSAWDFESVVLHEAGHFLGLDHTENNQLAVMYPTIGPGDVKRSLASPDLSDVCNVYPGSGTPGSQGSSCRTNSDCSSSAPACRSFQGAPAGANKICTVTCTTDAQCPQGYTCQNADTGKACLVPVGAPDLCAFCTDGSQCSTGNCVTDGRHNWCTTSCTSDLSCGPGYECVPGSGGNVCAPTGSCGQQCTGNAQCPIGYACVNGTCEATGNVGDRCELSAWCKPCAICIGNSTAAYCRSCCGGQGAGEYCDACSASSCGSGYSCAALVDSQDKVCVPDNGADLCQACSTSSPCAPGLTCVGGRCHASCSPQNPGPCRACYDTGSGGYCACDDEVSQVGQPCGPGSNGSFRACVNGLVCVAEGSTATCHRPCILGNAASCPSGETCQNVQGEAVCVGSGATGENCGPCNNGACAPGLTCVGNRCYEPCDVSLPVCTTCVGMPNAGGMGLCACADQRAGLNQGCGFVSEVDFYACQPGLLCLEGGCRAECNPASPQCEDGTQCRTLDATFGSLQGASFCLPPTSGANPDAGTQPAIDAGTRSTPNDVGCGCGSGVGPLGVWAVALLAFARRSRRRE